MTDATQSLTAFQTRLNNITAPATTVAAKTAALPSLNALNKDMAAAIQTAMVRADTQGSLGELGALRQQIARLKTQREEAQESADTALARKESVEKREAVVSPHQLFLIDRPMKQWSVPTLLTLSIVFVLLGMRWLYLVYYGVQIGPVSIPYLSGFGVAGSNATTAALRIPGQGITGQL